MTIKEIILLCCMKKDNIIYVDFNLFYKLKKEWGN